MYDGQIVFAQLMARVPRHSFNTCVRRYHGQRRVRRFSCRDQFLCMAFAQLTSRDSLRDIETCLRAMGAKLYHAGFRVPGGRVSRSTLADANEQRDWRIWADLAAVLIEQARRLCASDAMIVTLDQTVYAFDSTTIDLCLSLFPWAQFRRRKGAVKLHTLIDLRGNIPCFIRMTHGKVHDVKALDYLPIEPGAYYVMDRGYVDYARLHRFERAKAFFVIRAKKNMDFTVIASRPVDKATGLRCDQTITLCGVKSAKDYPDRLRRIRYTDPTTGKRLVLLTNCFCLDALTITRLYKARWQVELFFKWIKQHLRIKAFYGTSPNAVKTQVWIAVCVYVLVTMVAKEQAIARNPSEILQILGIMLFEKVPMNQALAAEYENVPETEDHNQLPLFDF
ncbi:MAG: IS4 family transposase [Dokdonella sp.]